MRAKRIEIPASITACEFYRKMGYDYKNGIDVVDEEQLFRLESFGKYPAYYSLGRWTVEEQQMVKIRNSGSDFERRNELQYGQSIQKRFL